MKNDFVSLSQKIKRKEMNKLTGHKDLEPKVLEYLDDKTLFNLLQTHPEYLKKVQGFAEKRVKDRYPTLVKWKDGNETWFHYYASIVYYLSLLKEKYDMEFIPFLFKGHDEQPKEILKVVEDFEHRNFSFELAEFIERYMLKHALYKLFGDEKKISIEEFNKNMGDIIRKMIIESETYAMQEIFLITLLELRQLDLFKEFWFYKKDLLKRYLNNEDIEEVTDALGDYKDSIQGDYNRYENAAVVSNDPEIMDYVAKKVASWLYFDKETAINQAIKEKNFDLIPFIESIEGEEK